MSRKRMPHRVILRAGATRLVLGSDSDILGQGIPDNNFEIWLVDLAPLAFDKMGPVSATVGEPITYELTAVNNLPGTLTSVVITDVMPINANYVSGGTLAGNVVSWMVASLSGGETIARQFVVTTTTSITNSDYGVSSGDKYSAAGSQPVVTVVEYPVAGLAATNDGR